MQKAWSKMMTMTMRMMMMMMMMRMMMMMMMMMMRRRRMMMMTTMMMILADFRRVHAGIPVMLPNEPIEITSGSCMIMLTRPGLCTAGAVVGEGIRVVGIQPSNLFLIEKR